MRAEVVTASGVRVSLRPASAADDAFLRHLDADRRRPEVDPLGWPEQAVTGFLDMQFRARQHGYRTAFPDADQFIVTEGGVPIGRLLVASGPVEHVVVDVVLLRRSRGRGIGTALMREVMADAARAGRPVRLTAATADPRVPEWYARLGFRVVERSDVDVGMVLGPP